VGLAVAEHGVRPRDRARPGALRFRSIRSFIRVAILLMAHLTTSLALVDVRVGGATILIPDDGGRCLLVQPPTENRYLIVVVAEPLIEAEYARIGAANHHLEFRDPALSDPLLASLHQRPAHPSLLVGWEDGQVVHPASVAVVADHRRTPQRVPVDARQHGRSVPFHGPAEVVSRVIPGPGDAGEVPQRHCRFMHALWQNVDLHRLIVTPDAGVPGCSPVCKRVPPIKWGVTMTWTSQALARSV
jgi:hypothetical protein